LLAYLAPESVLIHRRNNALFDNDPTVHYNGIYRLTILTVYQMKGRSTQMSPGRRAGCPSSWPNTYAADTRGKRVIIQLTD